MMPTLFKRVPGESQVKFYISKCKYCGKPFIKIHNKILYCSDECRGYALKEQKAAYQQKRRLLIKHGVLISNELNNPGTTFLSAHRQEDFNKESLTIRRELRRIGVKT